MKYICLVYHEENNMRALPDDELTALVDECGEWIDDLEKGRHHVYSAGLQSIRTAATIRRRNGSVTVTDGPFTETKEFLGGFTLIEARDMNEAIRLASKLPAARIGSIEVRPVLTPDLETDDPLDHKIAESIRRSVHGESITRGIGPTKKEILMEDVISQAKADFVRAKDQLSRAFATTPDDKINWAPSPTARTPVQIVVHCAQALKNINEFLDGRPFEFTDTAAADKFFRENERPFTTREEAVSLLEKNCAEYLVWLDALTPERLNTSIQLPFGLGSAPLAVGLTFPPAHTSGHAGQIEYIQTIYGDRDWHLNAPRAN
jgi:hypothetical protein